MKIIRDMNDSLCVIIKEKSENQSCIKLDILHSAWYIIHKKMNQSKPYFLSFPWNN